MKILIENFFIKNIRTYLIIMSPIIILQLLYIVNINGMLKGIIIVIELVCIVYIPFVIPVILLIFGFKLANREKKSSFLNYFMAAVIMVNISNYLSNFNNVASWFDNYIYALACFTSIFSETLNNFIIITGGVIVQIILLVKRKKYVFPSKT